MCDAGRTRGRGNTARTLIVHQVSFVGGIVGVPVGDSTVPAYTLRAGMASQLIPESLPFLLK